MFSAELLTDTNGVVDETRNCKVLSKVRRSRAHVRKFEFTSGHRRRSSVHGSNMFLLLLSLNAKKTWVAQTSHEKQTVVESSLCFRSS